MARSSAVYLLKKIQLRSCCCVVWNCCSELMNERNYLLKSLSVYLRRLMRIICHVLGEAGKYLPATIINIVTRQIFEEQKHRCRRILMNEQTERVDLETSIRSNFGFKFYLMTFKCFCGTKRKIFWRIKKKGAVGCRLLGMSANLSTLFSFCNTRQSRWQWEWWARWKTKRRERQLRWHIRSATVHRHSIESIFDCDSGHKRKWRRAVRNMTPCKWL